MTKLEDRIIKNMYRFETQRSLSYLIIRIIAVIIGLILIWASFYRTWERIIEWQGMDLLSYFNYDVIPFADRLKTILIGFYLESPKEAILILIIWLVIVLIILSGLLKKRKKIINRLKCLFNFWTNKC